MRSPVSAVVANLYIEFFEELSPQNSTRQATYLEALCRRHVHFSEER